jgi:hypothetical protein
MGAVGLDGASGRVGGVLCGLGWGGHGFGGEVSGKDGLSDVP